MGLISYIVILSKNLEIMTKISISLIIILLLYTIIILTKIYLDIKKEISTISNITHCTTIKKKNNNTYKIYESGIKEFINLYKNGITDTHTLLKLIKNTMKINIINKNIYIDKIKKIKFSIKCFIMAYLTIGFIYYYEKIVISYKKLNYINTVIILNEISIPIIISTLILVQTKIMENIFANLNFKIYNEQRIFIKKFIITLYHKFYD